MSLLKRGQLQWASISHTSIGETRTMIGPCP